MKKIFKISMLATSVFLFSGCGTIVGIPSHGGGKRFAVEQELISSTAKAVAQKIDVNPIRGKKATVFFVSIGDQGSGTLSGGRLNLASTLQALYTRTPPTIEFSTYPVVTTNAISTNTGTTGSVVQPQGTETTSTSTVMSGAVTQTSTGVTTSMPTSAYTENGTNSNTNNTVTKTLHNAPNQETSRQRGNGKNLNIGMMYNGLGSYTNYAISNPNDSKYLSATIQTHLIKNGVSLTTPDKAEVFIYIAVDVFGTVRSRTDLLLVNNEKLKAKTAVSIDYYSARTGMPIGEQQNIAFEAEYKENYIVWTGPFTTTKKLKPTKGIITKIENEPSDKEGKDNE